MTAGPTASDAAAAAAPRHRFVRLARVVYLVALAALLAWVVWTRREDLATLVDGTEPAWLVSALVLGVGQLFPSVLLWTVALRRLDGVHVPLRAVADATARSVPTRYLPGSVWYALGRAAILRQDHRVSARALGATAALESILAVVVAIVTGSALLAVAGRLPDRPVFLAVWFLGLGILGSPPVVNAALAFVARRRGTPADAVRLDWATYAVLAALTLLHWAWSATTFTVYLQAFPGLATVPIVEVAGSFLIAWVVGFLAIFAPQGAGAFELAAAAMLVGASGTAAAAVVVGGYRAMMVVRDVIVFAVATVSRRRNGDDGGDLRATADDSGNTRPTSSS